MKKILIIHTEYQEKGGEDIAVSNEIKFLKKYFKTEELIFSNKIDNYFSQTFNFLRNKNNKSTKSIKNKIDEFNPDIVYIHNSWFKISLGVFDLLQKKKIKPILKLHNFRYDCTKSQFISKHVKNNETCLACGLHNDNKFFNKYFENSYLKSFFVNYYGKKYFKIVSNYNLNLVVLTNFHKKYLKEVNLIEKEITVIPNIIELPKLEDNNMNKNYFVYAGRISKEKGVKELIEAFNKSNLEEIKLKIIGNGPDKNKLLKYNENPNVEFMDFLPNEKILELIKNSIAVVTATKLYEGQPTLLCEASSMGVPSIFPRTGGITEFFPDDYELSYEQFNYDDLKEKMINITKSSTIEKIGNDNKIYLEKLLNRNEIIEKIENLVHE
tara:strand:- start:4390 stop:5535 length:1146 start_codon:yes stop_codon:yes gene_type:complete